MANITKPHLTQILKISEIANANGVTLKNVDQTKFSVLIDDVIFDVNLEGEIISKDRLYGIAEQLFKTNKQKAKNILDQYAKWLLEKNVNESNNEDDEEEINEGHFMFIERKARAPKLKGRAEKQRKAKAEIMKAVNSDETFQAAQAKLLALLNRLAKQKAREKGINPALIDLTSVRITK